MDAKWLEDYSEKFKALGHPIRLQIVIGLMNNECNVTKICNGLNIPQATTSQHLAILKSRGIITGTRDGTSICYKVTDDAVLEMVNTLMEVTGCDPNCS